jgi:hypothetical protein
MEHAVIAHLLLPEDSVGSGREREAVADLADELQRAIEELGVGEFDGEEFGERRCVLYMYGRDADQLFEVAEPILKAASLARGGFVIKRYGDARDPGAVEAKVYL